MPAGAGRQLDGREEMEEDASWSLELIDSWTGGKMGKDACWSWWRLLDGREDGRRCLLELVDS